MFHSSFFYFDRQKQDEQLVVESALLADYRHDLLTADALHFMSLVQYRFGGRFAEIRAQQTLRQTLRNQGITTLDHFRDDQDSQLMRAANWNIAEAAISPLLKQAGVVLVSPACPDMIIKALTAYHQHGARPVEHLIDFEDAFHLDVRKALDGQRALMQVRQGKLQVNKLELHGQFKHYEYDVAHDGKNVIRVRINGHLAPPIDEITWSGKPVERSLFDFGLHFYHAVHQGIDPHFGPYYVLPKMEYELALLWRDIFSFSEAELCVPPKTIKVSIINETIKAGFEINEMIFVLAGGTAKDLLQLAQGKTIQFKDTWLTTINSGFHDRVFSAIKTNQGDITKIYPQASDVVKNNQSAQTAWKLAAEIALRRNLVVSGGMIVALTTEPSFRNQAIALTQQSLLRSGQLGCIQAWEAMPDTTMMANAILQTKFCPDHSLLGELDGISFGSKKLALLKEKEAQLAQLLNAVPLGEITSTAVYENIYKALEYIEAWLRGIGVIAFKNPYAALTAPTMMQNIATTERACAELWTWCKYRVRLADTQQTVTPQLIERYLHEVLAKIREAIHAGKPAKGKMSLDCFESAYYQEAAQLLIDTVLGKAIADAITPRLYRAYQTLQGQDCQQKPVAICQLGGKNHD